MYILILYAGLSAREEEEARDRDWNALMAMKQQDSGKKRTWDTMGQARSPLTEGDFNGNGSRGGEPIPLIMKCVP